jgi:hypothetical protein
LLAKLVIASRLATHDALFLEAPGIGRPVFLVGFAHDAVVMQAARPARLGVTGRS